MMQRVLGGVLFLVFVGLVAGRALLLRRRGVRAFVFGRTDRGDFLLAPVVALFLYTVLAGAFSLPLPAALRWPHWSNAALGWAGLALALMALVGLGLTLVSFGSSFRIGIDGEHPDKLVTTGAFAVSRNPIYACFFVFFLGMLLVFPSALLAAVLVLLTLAIHRQVLREEAFLRGHYGQEYADYCRRVRRNL